MAASSNVLRAVITFSINEAKKEKKRKEAVVEIIIYLLLFFTTNIIPSNSRELYLSSEDADITLDFRLHRTDQFPVGEVIEVDDCTLWQASSALLVVYCVWCVVLVYCTPGFDNLCTVVLEASGPPEGGRIPWCFFVVSPATLPGFLGRCCQVLPFIRFLHIGPFG